MARKTVASLETLLTNKEIELNETKIQLENMKLEKQHFEAAYEQAESENINLRKEIEKLKAQALGTVANETWPTDTKLRGLIFRREIMKINDDTKVNALWKELHIGGSLAGGRFSLWFEREFYVANRAPCKEFLAQAARRAERLKYVSYFEGTYLVVNTEISPATEE